MNNTLYNTLNSVTLVFDELEHLVKNFSKTTNLKCLKKCDICCKSLTVEATITECLPLAVILHKNQNTTNFFKLSETQLINNSCLINISPNISGKISGCQYYEFRPLICRLFGFSANKNKYDKPIFSACKIINQKMPDISKNIQKEIDKNNLELPIRSYFAMKIYNCAPELSNKYYPINLAIKYAVEKFELASLYS